MNGLAVSFHTRNHYSRFVSALAHETRSPLANIALSAEMLQGAITEGDKALYFDIIIRNSRRINDLVIELLEYQHSEEIQMKEYSLRYLLGEVLILTRDRINFKNIAVTEDYDMQDYKVSVNGPKLKVALTNIIINAVEAMVKDKGVLRVAIKAAYDKYILQIEDNGLWDKQRAFAPFIYHCIYQ